MYCYFSGSGAVCNTQKLPKRPLAAFLESYSDLKYLLILIFSIKEDATWYLGNTPNDSYVQQEADYFTKYTFQDTYRKHDVHGL
jgi:hypothetical protein